MFASKSIIEHLLRGVFGIAPLAVSVSLVASRPWSAVALLVIALAALRGCPMCWTVGLLQLLAARVLRRPVRSACSDGTCALNPPLGQRSAFALSEARQLAAHVRETAAVTLAARVRETETAGICGTLASGRRSGA